MIETEIDNHESSINKLLERIDQISSDNRFSDDIKQAKESLVDKWKSAKKMALERRKRVQDSVFYHKVCLFYCRV